MTDIPPDLDAAIELLETRLREQQADPIGAFSPYPKQRDFVAATATRDEVALMCGNQLGKTSTAGWAASIWLTGRYPAGFPGRKFPGPVNMWACGVTSTAVREIMQTKLCGPAAPGEEGWNSGFLPPGSIVNYRLGHGVSGAVDSISVRHAGGGLSTLAFKSFEQGRGKFQGATLDVVWLDEECPYEIYSECLARTIASGGLVLSTFTPLSGNFEIIDRFEEKSVEALKRRQLVHMDWRDTEHLRSEEARERLFSLFKPHERRARIDGLPMLGSGAVFGIDPNKLISPVRFENGEVIHEQHGPIESAHWGFLWGLDFGIAHPFAAVLIAYDRGADTIFVLKCFKMSDSLPAEHASRMRQIAPHVKVAWPHDGNQREKGSGQQLAELYKREGLVMLPSHSTFPRGGYDLEAGVEETRVRMASGRLLISRECLPLINEITMYRRDQNGQIVKKNDDALSALRQCVMMLRAAKPLRETSTYRGYDVSGGGSGSSRRYTPRRELR
jgi:phage terminase large subunit-like protein